MLQQRGTLFWWHLKGWLDWKRLGWLGQLHCFSFACLRKRAGCTGRVPHQLTYVESNLRGADLTRHSMTPDRRLWASGTRWACPLMATCTLSSAADPLSSSTVASACWNIGWTKGSWFACIVHMWVQICRWTVVAVYGLEGFWTCAECFFLLLLRQPWATSPQRLLLGKFLATPFFTTMSVWVLKMWTNRWSLTGCWQVPWLLVPFQQVALLWHSKRSCRHFQGAFCCVTYPYKWQQVVELLKSKQHVVAKIRGNLFGVALAVRAGSIGGLDSDLWLLRLLWDFSRIWCRYQQAHSWWHGMEPADLFRKCPWDQDPAIECRVGEWTPGDDGHHRHVFPGVPAQLCCTWIAIDCDIWYVFPKVAYCDVFVTKYSERSLDEKLLS